MKKFVILIPLYNDWKSAAKLLNEIDLQIELWEAEVSIVIVNDASIEERSGLDFNYKNIYVCILPTGFSHQNKTAITCFL